MAAVRGQGLKELALHHLRGGRATLQARQALEPTARLRLEAQPKAADAVACQDHGFEPGAVDLGHAHRGGDHALEVEVGGGEVGRGLIHKQKPEDRRRALGDELKEALRERHTLLGAEQHAVGLLDHHDAAATLMMLQIAGEIFKALRGASSPAEGRVERADQRGFLAGDRGEVQGDHALGTKIRDHAKDAGRDEVARQGALSAAARAADQRHLFDAGRPAARALQEALLNAPLAIEVRDIERAGHEETPVNRWRPREGHRLIGEDGSAARALIVGQGGRAEQRAKLFAELPGPTGGAGARGAKMARHRLQQLSGPGLTARHKGRRALAGELALKFAQAAIFDRLEGAGHQAVPLREQPGDELVFVAADALAQAGQRAQRALDAPGAGVLFGMWDPIGTGSFVRSVRNETCGLAPAGEEVELEQLLDGSEQRVALLLTGGGALVEVDHAQRELSADLRADPAAQRQLVVLGAGDDGAIGIGGEHGDGRRQPLDAGLHKVEKLACIAALTQAGQAEFLGAARAQEERPELGGVGQLPVRRRGAGALVKLFERLLQGLQRLDAGLQRLAGGAIGGVAGGLRPLHKLRDLMIQAKPPAVPLNDLLLAGKAISESARRAARRRKSRRRAVAERRQLACARQRHAPQKRVVAALQALAVAFEADLGAATGVASKLGVTLDEARVKRGDLSLYGGR